MRRLAAAIALSLGLAMPAAAKDLGVMGETFTIGEVDVLKVLASKLEAAEKSGKLAQIQREAIATSMKRAERPKPVEGLVRTKTARTWMVDPTFVVPEDYADHQGRVFARRGDRVNPLDRMPGYDRIVLFIDGDDPRQVARGLSTMKKFGEHRVRVVLTNGAPLELMRKHKVQVFFDQEGTLVQHFGITQVPALVERQGRLLKVTEMLP